MVSRNKVPEELLLAIESARTQFAVAIAAEAKSTPPERWQYYLDTADRMRWFMRRLRTADEEALPECQRWRRILQTVKQLPAEGKASRLCKIFRDIVTDME